MSPTRTNAMPSPSAMKASTSTVSAIKQMSNMHRQSTTSQRQSTSNRQSIAPKKKEKTIGTDVEALSGIDLHKFCPQKIYHILLLNETDDQSREIMKNINEASKEFEDISYLTLISYEDVMALVKNYETVELPPSVKTLLKILVQKLKESMKENKKVSAYFLAKLMKVKLIEVMYGDYVKAVTRMQRRRKLANDLRLLANDCWSPKYEGGTKEKTAKKIEPKTTKNDVGKKGSHQKTIEAQVIDFSNIPIHNEDDIIFDDDINHQVSIFVFHGFYDPDLLKEILIVNKVDLQSVMKFTITRLDDKNNKTHFDNAYSTFWESVYKLFDGPDRRIYLENTFLMTFTPASNDLKQILEELVYVIRNISDIKLQHVNYIRHMDIFRIKENCNYYPLECLTVYNNFFQKFPFELVNVPIILDTLLKQTCVSVDETYSVSTTTSQQSCAEASTIVRCRNPCTIDAFFRKKRVNESQQLKNIGTSFLAHENDHLTIALNSYKKYGSMAYETTLKILKHTKSLKDLSEFEVDYTDIIHKHGRDPSTKTVIPDKDIILHFMYLFLFSFFDRKDKNPPAPVETELTKNLVTYNMLDFIKSCQIKIRKPNSSSVIPESLYDTPSTKYFWKEKLEPSVLLQEVFKAQNAYGYCDQKFSPETDTLLIQFSDYLDEFGINVKVYQNSLLTTVCLRDFCRYSTVEHGSWLEKNKPPKYVRKCIVKEECQGVKRMRELFPEYRYLLDVETKKEPETDTSVTIAHQEEISFDQLVDELKNYPSNFNIVKECTKSEKRPKFRVYDLGTKYFQLKGSKTTFHSHDDVKISVDNVRMLDENEKCSVNLTCRNNSLLLHSSRFYLTDAYNFHINLADGTIVTFILPKPKKVKQMFKVIASEEKVASSIPTIGSMRDFQEQYKEKVISVEKRYFDKVAKTNLLNEKFSGSNEINFRPPESILERLKDAVASKVPIYKINNNFVHVKPLKSEFEIPLSNIIRSVMHTSVQKEDYESFTKRYVPVKDKKLGSEGKHALDARIALPNGLYISFYTSKLKKGYSEVKQEFLCRNPSTRTEEFRLFTRGGYIIIKKIDGSVTTLKCNGDIIEHEKLDGQSENLAKWSLKPCHCKTIDDYRKKLCKMMKYQNEAVTEISASRRACNQTRKGYVIKPETLSILQEYKVPYQKTTLLKFDGTRVCLESGKVKMKKLHHVTFENNFAAQEIYYERSDGFKSSFDKYGRQIVEFVDGTKIASIVHVSKDLVDGYVYISLEFEYEHPSYATVSYNPENDLQLLLNKSVVLKKSTENALLNIDEDIEISVCKENIIFEKTCPTCNGKYITNFNIFPLVSGEVDFSDNFVHATDSYNKHFYSDFGGNCERNTDYIAGPINSVGCNHYDKMAYKKLFVINRDWSGETYWTDKMVMAKKKASSQNENCTLKEFSEPTNPKIQVYKFKRQYYEHYSSRFLNKGILNISDSPKDLMYSTFCVVRRLVEPKTLKKFLSGLMYYFSMHKPGVRYCNVVERMIKDTETLDEKDIQPVKEVKPVVVEPEKCICVRQKLTMRGKIRRWKKECEKYRAMIKNLEVPCYFESEFCETIKRPY